VKTQINLVLKDNLQNEKKHPIFNTDDKQINHEHDISEWIVYRCKMGKSRHGGLTYYQKHILGSVSQISVQCDRKNIRLACHKAYLITSLSHQ